MMGLLLATFIVCFFAAVFLRGRQWLLSLPLVLAAIAGILNSLVCLANGNHMPASMPHPPIPDWDKFHIEASSHTRLLWLADVHGGMQARYSLGDVFCSLALPALLVVAVVKIKQSWGKI